MKKIKRDFLLREPIKVLRVLVHIPSWEASSIARKLPDNYLLTSSGHFYFPAGVRESYVINGKEYNFDGKNTLEEQKNLIMQDLEKAGFNQEESKDFIDTIEVDEREERRLSFDESGRWLKLHPEFENEAMKKLKEMELEIKKESELSKKGRRR